MPLLDETFARLKILVWVAQADGDIQPWEETILNQAIQALRPSHAIAEPVTLDRLLSEPLSITEALSAIQSPEAQRATYEEAVAIAQLSGITSAEEQRLAQIRSAFHLDSESGNDEPASSVNWGDASVSGRGVVLGMRRLINHSRQVRSLIFDYAIGAAIIGLIPIPHLLIFKLLGVAALILKMLRDIGSHWGFPKGVDGFAILGNLFGFVGALAIAFMAWLTVFGLGILYPSIRVLSLAAAISTLTWTLGQITNQYYMSSSRLDIAAMRRVIQYQANAQARGRWQRWIAQVIRR